MSDRSKNTATVFVIEDEPVTREAVRVLAQSMGLLVEEFERGEDFLNKRRDEVGCIVADLRLQDIGGVELLEQLRAEGRLRPTVIITGYATTRTVVRAMQLGAITVLDKPFDAKELSSAIEQAIQEDKSQRAKMLQIDELKEKFSTLTNQERTVLKLIVDGHINKQISKHLDVSIRTVESRRQQIFRKTETKNLGELIWQTMLLRTEGYSSFTEGNIEPKKAEESTRTH